MRQKIEQLKNTLHAFIDQSDDLLLVISALDTDMALVHKIVEGVDQEQPADIVLRFAHPGDTADRYVGTALLVVDAQIDGVNAVRVAEGLPEWQKLPPACHDPNLRPERRVQIAMQHVRSFFPKDEDHRVVWCFLPPRMADPIGYASFIGALTPVNGIEPWMHSQRIVARDDRGEPFLVPQLHKHKIEGTLVFHADFSIEALLDSMAAEVQNPDTPEAARMQTLLQLASVDYANKRYSESIAKHAILYDYFKRVKKPVLQGFCLGGVADVLFATGHMAEAKKRYKQGLALASPSGITSLPVVMQLSAKAGDVCAARGEYAEAEEYFDLASQIAGKLVSLEFKVDCMEKIGMTREARGKSAAAAEVWKNGIALCKEGDYFIRQRTIAERLVNLYRTQRMPDREIEAQLELDLAERACRERYG